jgi:phosphoglycolate phosphatase
MSYKAVLFDLDGTLLDTLEDLANAGNRVLAEFSLPTHPVDAYRYFVGAGLSILMERILPENQRQPETVAATMTAFERIYAKTCHDRTAPYTGVPEMLNQLVDAGLQVAILSNKPHDFTLLCVKKMLPQWPFQPIFGQREGIAKKPDPAGALEAAEYLGCTPQEVLYVGDTSIDMHTARSAGMDSVGVLWGFRDAKELQEAGAAHLIRHPQELLPIALAASC